MDRLGRRLAQTLELETAASVILEEGLALFHCDAGHIRILDKAAQHLKKLASIGPASDKLLEVRKLGEGLAGDVALNAKHRIIPDISRDPQVLQIIRTTLGLPPDGIPDWIHSEVCFSLTIEGEVIGTLNLHSPHADWFGDPDSVSLLSNLTNRGALALRAAILIQATERALRARELALSELRDIGLTFVKTLDLDRFLRGVLRAALRQSGITSGTVRILNETETAWVLRAVDDEEATKSRLRPELPATIELFQQAASVPHATWIPDTSQDSRFLAFKEQVKESPHGEYLAAVLSLLIVPMRISERARGLIFLCPHTVHQLENSTVQYLEILGAEAALALSTLDAHALARREKSTEPLRVMGEMLNWFLHAARSRIYRLRVIVDTMEVSASTDELKKEITALFRFLHELTDFTKKGLSRCPVDLKAVVRKILTDYSFDRRITCTSHFDGASTVIRGDSALIEKCIMFLLDNAVDAICEGECGTVSVGTTGDDSTAVVWISDTGKGMTEGVKAKCFDPHFTTKPSGYGMGLPSVRDIVEQHGGSVGIESTPGKGTIVSLRFPKKEAANAATTSR